MRSWWMRWTHWTGMFSINCMFSSWSSEAVRDTSSATLAHAASTSVSLTHSYDTHTYTVCIYTAARHPAQRLRHTDWHTHTFHWKDRRQRVTWNITSSSSSSSHDPWPCLASCFLLVFICKQKLVPSPPELLSWRVNMMCHTACCLRILPCP